MQDCQGTEKILNIKECHKCARSLCRRTPERADNTGHCYPHTVLLGDLNSRLVEGLIYAGAFDEMGVRRSQLEQIYEDPLRLRHSRLKANSQNCSPQRYA